MVCICLNGVALLRGRPDHPATGARPERSLRRCLLTGSNSTYCCRKACIRTERQIPTASNRRYRTVAAIRGEGRLSLKANLGVTTKRPLSCWKKFGMWPRIEDLLESSPEGPLHVDAGDDASVSFKSGVRARRRVAPL